MLSRGRSGGLGASGGGWSAGRFHRAAELLSFGGSSGSQQGVPMRLALLVGGILVFATAPAAAQPPDVQFLSNTVSTDLLLAESKEPIHWLRLQCRLAHGGSGTLTLDPTVPKFNEF